MPDLDGLRRLLNPDFLRKAQRSALTGTRNKARTQISKTTRRIYNVSARAISDRVAVYTSDDNQAVIKYIGTRIGLINFSAKFKKVSTSRGVRQGVTAKVRKDSGKAFIKRGFIASGNNRNIHIFHRIKDNQKTRLPIMSLKGPSIPQMVQQGEVFDDMSKLVETQYPEILANKMQFYLDKQYR